MLTRRCQLEPFTDIARNCLTLKNGTLTQFVKFRDYKFTKLVVYFADEKTYCKKCASHHKSTITHFRLYPLYLRFQCVECGKNRDYRPLAKKWKKKIA